MAGGRTGRRTSASPQFGQRPPGRRLAGAVGAEGADHGIRRLEGQFIAIGAVPEGRTSRRS